LNQTYPKISIVTPSYNQGKYIEQTILSVINQNYPNLEYIIIDGGSTDETVDIIKKYEQHITYWVSEKDNGQSHAINKGIEKCTGEIFNWLNSDDWYEPDVLFIVANEFINDTSLEFVSGFENHVYENGETLLYNGTYLNKTIEETIETCEVAQPSTFFKLDSIKTIGGVSNDLHYVMDGHIWIRLLLLRGFNHFKKIDKTLVNFRYHESSKSVSVRLGNNFLIERTGIITSLQTEINLPDYIIDFYKKNIYKTPQVIDFNSEWIFNKKILTCRRLKIYFIKKYINKQFIYHNKQKAFKGFIELIRCNAFDQFFFTTILKFIFK
jgi:glycosyltransferase involved in cell wall biosynthesis